MIDNLIMFSPSDARGFCSYPLSLSLPVCSLSLSSRMFSPSDARGFRAAEVELEILVVDDVDDWTNDGRPVPRDPIQKRLQPP